VSSHKTVLVHATDALRLARIGGVYPIGNKVTTVNVAGFNWDLYIGPNGSMKVFSFIPADGSWKFSFNADLKQFFNYLAQSQGYPINNQNLIGEPHKPLFEDRADFGFKFSSRVPSPSLVLRPHTLCQASPPA
jgi:hypothetical protein